LNLQGKIQTNIGTGHVELQINNNKRIDSDRDYAALHPDRSCAALGGREAMNPYSSPQRAAGTAADVLSYLVKYDRPKYVYRGQTREYPPPLLPSAYRGKRTTGATYDSKSREYALCMRKVGRRFVGIHRFRNFNDVFLAYSGDRSAPGPHEAQTLRQIAHDPRGKGDVGSKAF